MEGQKISFKKFLPGIAWFFIVDILTLIPGSDVPKIGWLNIPYFDKIVHATLFGGLTILFCLPFFKAHFSLQKKINYFIRISLAAITWGITIEFIQKFYVPGRSFDLLDWAADTAGVLIGFWICRKIVTSKFYAKQI
ncbi:MAG: VanZ family protein [Ginsengibacter sp.]